MNSRLSVQKWHRSVRMLILCKYYFTYSNEIAQPLPRKAPVMCPEDAVKFIKSGNLIFVAGAAATPEDLLNAMVKHARENCLKNIRTCHMHLEGKSKFLAPENKDIFRSISFFMGANVRKAVAEGRGDNIGLFLQDIPRALKRIYKPDVALIHVSPPDRHGYCTFGTSIDCVRTGCMQAKYIIAQINPQMPRTFGDSIIHCSHFDAAIEIDHPIFSHPLKKPSKVEQKIGKFIAEKLVRDGATLQMGIGSIPDAVLSQLHNHKDLGIHSEMFADGVVPLVEKGIVTNARKPIHTGRIVGSFLIGSQKLYDFIDDNPLIEMHAVDYVNSTAIIRQQPQMTAINSCIEVDLTGQISSDSIGTRFYSGFGGQVDFLRGAAEGMDGKGVPVICLPSVTKKGESKIVPTLKIGAGVVTTRAHVYYVVTEYGIAQLFGRTMRQRAYELIQISHPKHREKLEKAAFKRLKVMPSKD